MYRQDCTNGCTQNRHKENLKKLFFFERWLLLNIILKIVSIAVHKKGIENKTKRLKKLLSTKTLFDIKLS